MDPVSFSSSEVVCACCINHVVVLCLVSKIRGSSMASLSSRSPITSHGDKFPFIIRIVLIDSDVGCSA